jgi:uncharacterized HAD superfamily protein
MRIVGIDFDDTIADTANAFLNVLRDKYNFSMDRNDWHNYHFSRNPGVIKVDVLEVFKEAWRSPESIKLLDPEIPEIIKEIHKKFKVYIVTATLAERSTVKVWLKEHDIDFDEIVYVEHARDKGSINGISIYIDDYYEAAVNIAEKGKDVIVLKQPWNSRFSFSGNKFEGKIIFAENWEEIRKILNKGNLNLYREK